MNTDKEHRNKKEDNQKVQRTRIDLNNPKDINNTDRTLRKHSDQNLNDLDRNLNEQFGSTGNTIAPEPNDI